MDEVVQVLPVGPWLLAAVSIVLVVALGVPPGGPRPALLRSGPGPLAGAAGAAGLAVLALAVVLVGRLGDQSELDNPVPALVLGLGWPALLLLPGLVGLVRPRPDARPDADAGDSRQEAPAPPRGDSRPAAVAALAVVAYLTVPVAPTRPAALATAVATYALVVAAACVAFGRRAVAARGEVLGLLASWASVGRALPRWAAPRGALAVLAVLLGGAWFERYERSTAFASGAPGRGDSLVGLTAAVLLAALGAAALHRATRRGSTGTAAAVLLPLSLATAAAGVARRALISAQLLLDQSSGPRAIDPDPLGIAGGQALALGLVTLGGALAAVVLARRMGPETARLPGAGVLLLLTAVSAWVVLQP